MAREVLENYLSRSISFTELLHDDLMQSRNSRGVEACPNGFNTEETIKELWNGPGASK